MDSNDQTVGADNDDSEYDHIWGYDDIGAIWNNSANDDNGSIRGDTMIEELIIKWCSASRLICRIFHLFKHNW